MDFARTRLVYLAAIAAFVPITLMACKKTPAAKTGEDGPSDTSEISGRPNHPGCPSGKFCAPAAASVTGKAAPAPYESCAFDGVHPDEVGRDAEQSSRSVFFNEEDTKAERTKSAKACCYRWTSLCGGGRAFRDVSGASVVAPARERTDWNDVDLDALSIGELSQAERTANKEHWTREAAFEHASIASFAQLALDLMALGAPADLLEGAHRAALDEIAHARVAFALATAYGGRSVGPAALAVVPRRHTTLEDLACSTLVDGCVGESIAAAELAEAARAATSPALAKILATMADDEERHATLAWRIVAWARLSGGVAVARALAETMRGLSPEQHGTSLRASILREVISPCAAALS